MTNKRLTESEKNEIVWLREHEGLSVMKIAVKMKRAETTVKKVITNARRLKELDDAE